MTQEDWDLIYKVHVLGAIQGHARRVAALRDKGYGRVIFTASAAGIYGNFGQANYAMAKLGLVGIAHTLALEGAKKNMRVNAIAPIAGSRMTETVLPKEILDSLKPELVSPLVACLCHESCEENGSLFEVGGGFYAKLRWERAEGKTFRLGAQRHAGKCAGELWSEITSFEKSTHPTNITASMQPIMANVQAGPSKGGNDLIDVDAALGFEMPTQTTTYDERDLAIYALGVGAAQDPLGSKELRYVYEMRGDGFQPLPSFGVIPALNVVFKMAKEGKQAPGMNYGFDRILHGEQYMELKRPLPTHAKLTHKAKIKDIFDKGKNAIVVTEITSSDETGEPLLVNEITTFVRGAGGWGGDRGPQRRREHAAGSRARRDRHRKDRRQPSAPLSLERRLESAPRRSEFRDALRLRKADFARPLHVRLRVARGHQEFLEGRRRFFKSISVRFSESVFPGETLVTEMWKEDDQKIIFRCKVKERDKVVISNAAVELYKEIPVAKPKAKEAATPQAHRCRRTSASRTAPTFSAASRSTSRKIRTPRRRSRRVYHFKLTGPDSTWTVNLKDGNGRVGRRRQRRMHARIVRRGFHRDVHGQSRSAEALYRRQAQDLAAT